MTAPLPPPADPSPPRRLPVLLRHAWFGLNQTFRRRIAHTGCTPDQYTVLRNLAEARPATLTQTELTRRMASDPNTVASLVKRMEQLGWLTRPRDPRDRRARRLKLQPAGRRRYKELRTLALHLQREVLNVLPPPEQERFLQQLQQVANACDPATRKDPPRPFPRANRPSQAPRRPPRPVKALR